MRFYSDSKKILHITLPLLSARLMNVVVFFLGFIMIAKLGPGEFAASALASNIFVTVIMLGVGILYATGIKISHAFGAKHHSEIREYFYAGLTLSVIIGALSIVVLLGLSFLLPYLGQKPVLIPYAKTFMHALCLPIIPGIMVCVPNQLVTALSKPRIVLISSFVNVPITLIPAYCLILGHWGFPRLGIWGFGIALLIGEVFLVLVPLTYALTTRYFRPFNLLCLRGLSKVLKTRMIALFKLGLPMGVQYGAEIAAFSAIGIFIGWFGIPALNSYQIALQIIVICIMPTVALAEAAAILVGNAMGQKDLVAARSYGFSSITLSILILLFIDIIIYTLPHRLISIYIDVKNPLLSGTVALSTLFLYVGAVTQIFDGARNVIAGALRGLQNSKYPMYIGIVTIWCIALPTGAALAFWLKLGPIGFSVGAGFSFLIATIITFAKLNHSTQGTHNAP